MILRRKAVGAGGRGPGPKWPALGLILVSAVAAGCGGQASDNAMPKPAPEVGTSPKPTGKSTGRPKVDTSSRRDHQKSTAPGEKP